MSFMRFLNECKHKIPSPAIQDIFIAQKNIAKLLPARRKAASEVKDEI